jgi:hypothetical protein
MKISLHIVRKTFLLVSAIVTIATNNAFAQSVQSINPDPISPMAVCNAGVITQAVNACNGGTCALANAASMSLAASTHDYYESINGGAFTLVSVGNASKNYTTGVLNSANTYDYYMIATGGSCTGGPITSATYRVIFDATPTTATVGANQNLCGGTAATLSGNVPVTGAGTWTKTGTATITTPGSATSGVTGISGSPTFTWTITNGVCSSTSPALTITKGTLQTPDAGPDQAICGATTATMNAVAPAAGGVGAWSLVSGGGSITTSALRTSGLTALPNGANTFRWTITSAACTSNSPVSDDVIINTVTTFASSNAGVDQNVCNPTSVATMAGSAPSAGSTGTWTLVSGTGTITSLNSTTSGLTGLADGDNVFQWTVVNGSCTSSDNVIITRANGGTASITNLISGTVCGGTSAIVTVAGSAGSVQWQDNTNGAGWVTGAGTNANSWPYTTAALSNPNSYQFRVLAGGLCPGTASAAITPQVDATSLATVGVKSFACNDGFTLTGNTPAVGTGAWSFLVGSGTVTTPSSPTSTVTGLAAGLNVLRWTITSGACSHGANLKITEGAFEAGVSQACLFTPGTVTLTLPATTSLGATNYTGSIQWQQNVNNAGWVDIGGATATPYTTGALTTSTATPAYYRYRAKFTNGGCTDYSKILSVGDNTYCTTTCATCTAISAPTCTGDATTGCTWTVNSADATAHALNGGAKLCIVSGGTYTGAIDVTASGTGGSVVVASGGAFNPASIGGWSSIGAAGTTGVIFEIQSGATSTMPAISLSSSNSFILNNCGTTTVASLATASSKVGCVLQINNPGALTITGAFNPASNNVTVNNTGNLTMGAFSASSSTVNLNNTGTITMTGTFSGASCTCNINNASTINAGTYDFTFASSNTFCNSGSMIVHTIAMSSSGAINNSGTIHATGNVTMSSCVPGINVCPNSTLTIDGNLSASSSTLQGVAPCGKISVGGVSDFSSTTLTTFNLEDAGAVGSPGSGQPYAHSCSSCTSSGMGYFDVYCSQDLNLPIKLLSFTAQYISDDKVEAKWITATETHNDYFTVERSADGQNFQLAGIVKGAGTSSEKLSYSFVDEHPFSGISYYRLRQTDFDGKYSLSKIVAVEQNKNTTGTIFPNPTSGSYTIRLTGKNENQVVVAMYDMLGQIVYNSSVDIVDGLNLIKINPSENIATGIYYVNLLSRYNTFKHKLIIEK